MVGCMQAEDNLAQAFCIVGKLQLSVDHCKASIQVKKNLQACYLIGWLVSATLQQKQSGGGVEVCLLTFCLYLFLVTSFSSRNIDNS